MQKPSKHKRDNNNDNERGKDNENNNNNNDKMTSIRFREPSVANKHVDVEKYYGKNKNHVSSDDEKKDDDDEVFFQGEKVTTV